MKKQYENCYDAALDFIVITQELNSIYNKIDKSLLKNDEEASLAIRANRLESRFYLLKHSLEKIKITGSTALELTIQLNNIDKEYTKNAKKWSKDSILELENQVYINNKEALLENLFF